MAKRPVFEVDQPGNIELKRSNLNQALGELPEQLRFVSVDFDAQELGSALASHGYSSDMIELILHLFSPAECLQFIEANETPRPVTVRTNTLKTRRRELAQALIAQAPTLVPKTCFSDSVSEEDMYEPPRVVLRGFWDSGEEVSWLAAQISARHAAGERYAQMAVLVRSAEHARAIAAALMAAGVPVTSQAGDQP